MFEEPEAQKEDDGSAASVVERDSPFYNDETGLYFSESAESKAKRLSAPLHIDALVRSVESNQWGMRARWRDPDSIEHVKVFPLAALQGDGLELFRVLSDEGLLIEAGLRVRNLMLRYLTCAKPMLRLTVSPRTGWCRVDDEWVFVTPALSVGPRGDLSDVVLAAEQPVPGASARGSAREWREGVGRYCEGNTRLLLVVSMAFASVLLPFSTVESGGLHLIGSSSVGKTTVARAGASVFGGPDYLQRWRATTNGLETMAAMHHCRLLVLDEMGQVGPREVGESMYMLANGQGKQRATRTGAAARRQTWQLLFLSTGEVGLAQHMAAAGKTVRAGQEVRLAELQADAEAGHGAFEVLHECTNGAALSEAIRIACAETFGTVGLEFIRNCAKEQDNLPALIRGGIETFVRSCVEAHGDGGELSGQARRVAERFGLKAVAGELATKWGLTGWTTGAALDAALHTFGQWVDARGTAGNTEPGLIIAVLREFISRHEESRFDDIDERHINFGTPPVRKARFNRVGWRKRMEDGHWEYLFDPAIFRNEVFAGYDMKQVCHVLSAAGYMECGEEGGKMRYTLQRHLSELPRRRVYVINEKIWADEAPRTERSKSATDPAPPA